MELEVGRKVRTVHTYIIFFFQGMTASYSEKKLNAMITDWSYLWCSRIINLILLCVQVIVTITQYPGPLSFFCQMCIEATELGNKALVSLSIPSLPA